MAARGQGFSYVHIIFGFLPLANIQEITPERACPDFLGRI